MLRVTDSIHPTSGWPPCSIAFEEVCSSFFGSIERDEGRAEGSTLGWPVSTSGIMLNFRSGTSPEREAAATTTTTR